MRLRWQRRIRKQLRRMRGHHQSLALAVAKIERHGFPLVEALLTVMLDPTSSSSDRAAIGRVLSVSGAGQVSTGQAFQPIIVRVTDSATTPNAVIAAPVVFQTTVLRPGGTSPGVGDGETNPVNPSQPVILQIAQSTGMSDVNGFANIVPSRSSFSPPVEVDVWVAAGSTALLDLPLQVLPALSGGSSPSGASSEPAVAPVRHPNWRGVNTQ